MTLVIAAHDEERVIEARLRNALALDYPADRLEVVVSLDGSTDATGEIAPGLGRARARQPARRQDRRPERGGGGEPSDLVAFSDANSLWAPDALGRLVGHFADPAVGYVCGRLALVDPDSGANVEGTYWRMELWLRAQESRMDSITAGNGAIYVVRRDAYIPLSPTHSHDIGLPFRLRRQGLLPLYEPGAVATEPAAPTTAAEWPRKVRMQSRSWHDVLRGGMLDPRGLPPRYVAELLSHRLLRYATGPLHLVVLACALLLAPSSRAARALVAAHVAWLALAEAGRRGTPGRLAALAWYYLVVTAASAAGLVRMLREGPQATWTPVEGTR